MSKSPEVRLIEIHFQDLPPDQYCMQLTQAGYCRLFNFGRMIVLGEVVPGAKALEIFARAFQVDKVPETVKVVCEPDSNVFCTEVYFDGVEMEERPDCFVDDVNWDTICWAFMEAEVPFEYPCEPAMSHEWIFTAEQITLSRRN